MAIEKDNFEVFIKLLQSKQVHIQDYEEDTGNNPLHLSVKSSRYQMVEYIIQNVPNLEKEDKNFDGDTALMLAVLYSDLKMVRLLCEKGEADVNAKESEGFTIFIAACANGKIDIVEFLLSHPACNLYSKNYQGQTALHRAAFYGEIKIIRLIRAKTKLSLTSRDSRGNNCLHFSAMRLNLTCYRYILKKLGDQGEFEQKKKNQEGMTPVQLLIKSFNMIRKDDKIISEQDVITYINDPNNPPTNLFESFKDQQQKPNLFPIPEKQTPYPPPLYGFLNPEPLVVDNIIPEKTQILISSEEKGGGTASKIAIEEGNHEKQGRHSTRFLQKPEPVDMYKSRSGDNMLELNLLRQVKSPSHGADLLRNIGSPINLAEGFEFSSTQLRKPDQKEGLNSQENNLLRSRRNLQTLSKLPSMANAFKKKIV